MGEALRRLKSPRDEYKNLDLSDDFMLRFCYLIVENEPKCKN